MAVSTFDIDAPRWDQSTFMGRLKHFFNITDCTTALLPDSRLDEAKLLVESCRAGSIPPGTTEEQLHYAKKLYDSAFHPDTGDRMNLIGRMSFQVPGGMAITGAMLQFYRTVPAVVFWQWVNQSFNALVNYTNRNAASPITPKQIGVAYVTATGTALATAVGLNLYTKKAPPLVARWVPFAAVAAANFSLVTASKRKTTVKVITMTQANLLIALYPLPFLFPVILPIIMQRLEKYKFMQRITYLHGPIQVMMVGVFLVFMVPAACSLFPQRCSMAVSKLEPELRDSIMSRYGESVQHVYFNKGL
uniref:Sideroflexin 2 n=1 Tax=Myripristis murdjan TaxID=586833 RepID=A0A668A0Y5_9TELE